MSRLRKAEILEKLYSEVVFGIVRTHSHRTAVKVTQILIESGFELQEISMTTPGALEVIRTLVQEFPDVIIGAGTVLDPVTARLVIDAGASFIVTPNLEEDVLRMANRYGIPVIPGIGTITEIVRAMEWGADVVKAFPGSVLGPAFIKAVSGPIPQIGVVPVGGVDISNLNEWINAGAYALGLGSGLTHPGGNCEDEDAIRRNAREILEIIRNEKIRRSVRG